MNEAMLCFLELVKTVLPWDLSWRIGFKAYRFVLDALTGRDPRL